MSKYYSLMIIPDGVETPIGIRIRAWLFKTILVVLALMFVSMILLFSLYGNVLLRASQVSRLEKENEELKRYKYKVGLLEARIEEARAIVNRISELAGVDIKMPELPADSTIVAETEESLPAAIPGTIEAGRPDGLPLQGYITRTFAEDSVRPHPGIDLAATTGTTVYATGAGKVVFAANDSTYGLTVIVQHDSLLSTLYGHNSKLLVKLGDEVKAGSRIALSGNTGKSTAPHLHYEIRENDKPVDPLKYISKSEGANE